MTDTVSTAAAALAVKTADAYSAAAFGAEWPVAANMLLNRGYSEREAEAILRSKWTRWCREDYEGTAADLAAFLDDPKNNCSPAAVAELVRGTF
jgi:hypothetical protein